MDYNKQATKPDTIARFSPLASRAALLSLWSTGSIAAVAVFHLAGHPTAYSNALVVVIGVVLAVLCVEIASKIKRGDFGLDLIAALGVS